MTLNQAALEKAQEAFFTELGLHADTGVYRAIAAYLTEISKTHAIVPRELDEDILEGMFARTEGFPMAEMDEIHAALIAEIDAREAQNDDNLD